MRRGARIGLKLAALLALTAATAAAWLVAALPAGLVSRPLGRRVRGGIFTLWSRCALRVLGAEVEVRGRPPRPPFLLVSNHLSYVDVPVLASRVPAAFVAKSEVRRWPIIGLLAALFDTVFIARHDPKRIPLALAAIERKVESGHGVVLFPEGTSSPGARVLPFRSALMARAAARQMPVWWSTLGYTAPDGELPAHLSICWWGEMTFLGHLLDLLALPRFRATVVFGGQPIRDGDRKRLADSLQSAVVSRFVPVVDPEEPWPRS